MSTFVANKRNLLVDIYDYSGNKVCPLFDSRVDIEGQATNVKITRERNGWKELSFTIPSDDYRFKYLIADYRLKVVENDGKPPCDPYDWYLITKPTVNHTGHAKTINVTAGHISQLLKTKNLSLEFSDKEGNNVGRADQLLGTVLDGTGWSPGTVAEFREDKYPNELKYRSLVASTKTGAFKLVQNICDLFEAKPIYHGYNKTVDLVPLNPFAKKTDEEIIRSLGYEDVFELHYGKNVKTISRTLNTENLCTKLYAYGAYGKNVDEGGYCGIDECTHTEYTFTVKDGEELAAGSTYYFAVVDSTGTLVNKHFTLTNALSAGAELTWSEFDPASMMYIWDETNEHAEHIYAGIEGECIYSDDAAEEDNLVVLEKEEVLNNFSFLMDFSYYVDAGLFTDEMLQALAAYQRNGVELLSIINEASTAFANDYTELTSLIGTVDYVKLNVDSIENDDGHIQLVLDDEQKVIYYTDYYNKMENHFKWRKALSIKANGDPLNEEASVIYCIWTDGAGAATGKYSKYYIKSMDDEADPYVLTLFGQYDPTDFEDCEFYLLKSNSVTGYLGAYEAFDEAAVQELDSQTTSVTVKHPTIFSTVEPEITESESSFDYPVPEWVVGYNNQYAWWWKFYEGYCTTPSELYFCWKSEGDDEWKLVTCSEDEPTVSPTEDGVYYYNRRKAKLYRAVDGEWVYLDDDNQQRVTLLFSTVYMYGQKRDQYYKGLYQTYITSVDGAVPGSEDAAYLALTEEPADWDENYENYYRKDSVTGHYRKNTTSRFDAGLVYKYVGFEPGNYYVENPYDDLWCFTSDQKATQFSYDTTDGFMTVRFNDGLTAETTVDVKTINKTAVKRHPENAMGKAVWENGTLDENSGEKEDTDYVRTNFCEVYPNLTYTITSDTPTSTNITVHFYTKNHAKNGTPAIISYPTQNTFVTPENTAYVRIVTPAASGFQFANNKIQAPHWDTAIIVGEYNDIYYKAEGLETVDGQCKGLAYFITHFYELTDKVYLEDYQTMKTAQDEYNEFESNFKDAIGDMYREGYWQKADYVNGDEDKLYADALDNLKQISQPEATYNVDYVDLFDVQFGEDKVKWPDFDENVAIHLIDESIGINKWAYLDKVIKCYTDPKQTQITINTNLTTCAQHSFTDVLQNIANVASEVKGKTEVYDRAEAISSSGTIKSISIDGPINTDTTTLQGGSSTWYTDKDGNIVLETADGQGAMKLTGSGFCISNGKDKYGDWIWSTAANSNGLNATAITTGFLDAQRILADSITAREIAAQSITAEEISARAITAEKIDTEAITTDKIEAGAVITSKIGNGVGNEIDISQNETSINHDTKISFVVGEDENSNLIITDRGMNFIGDNLEAHLPPDGHIMYLIDKTGEWMEFNDSGLVLARNSDEAYYATRIADDGFFIHYRKDVMEKPVVETPIVGQFTAKGLETRGVTIGSVRAAATSSGGWVWQWEED